MRIDDISAIVVDECIAIHRELGPGLFENVYETVLAGRLEARGLKVARQVPVPLVVDGHAFDAAFKIDILVDERLILEIKSVEKLSKAHARHVAHISSHIQAASRAASQFFRSNNEGWHSTDGQRPQTRINLCGLCENSASLREPKKWNDKIWKPEPAIPEHSSAST